MEEGRENVIDRVAVKQEIYEALGEISSKHDMASVELIGFLEEIKTAITIDTTIYEWKQEQMQ